MDISRREFAGLLGTAVVVIAAATNARAEAFPSRTVRIIVPFSAGGSADVTARILAEGLNAAWGQPVIIENKPGAGTTLASNSVARSAPDGYTLYLAYNQSFAATASLYRSLPYDPIKDFTPISMVAEAPFVLSVGAGVAAKDFAEFIALAKATADGLNFGSTGVGAGPHLATELFLRAAGIKAVHVPFRGTNEVVTQLLGGHIQFSFLDASALGQLRSGQIRPLAVTTAARWPQLPDVPTVQEALKAEFTATSGSCILCPPGMPEGLVQKLNASITDALRTPDVIRRLAEQGFTAVSSTPPELATKIRADIDRLGSVIRDLNLRAN